ncbi:thioredoxin family protein [Dysgonomonas sp. 521]|uniref:thioredoxin family protein n=1 Tax=Dysgonomonas sp. 521 TaxID=2302932 RepID=UPI0013D77F1A|nr:thioredoxin family protein [Dysgonomonas sp. 521]
MRVLRFFVYVTFWIGCHLSAQEVQLQAPALAGKEAKLYYFSGAKVDSLHSAVDASGKAAFTILAKDYRGMAALVVPGAGGVELVVAEPSVTVECISNQLNTEMATFPDSTENSFLKHIFTNQSRYMQQQAWLQAGNGLFDAGSPVLLAIQPELEKVETSMQALDKEIAASKLYAARYFRVSDYLNRLFAAEQRSDKAALASLRREMEEELDIVALYTSGQLWNAVVNLYLSLFNRAGNDDKQQQYASSVLTTLQRLPAPCYEAFLAGCITETERFGWREAQDSILSGIFARHPGFSSSITGLQRSIGAYLVKEGKSMPPVLGLEATGGDYNKMLLVFYDSDCNVCVNEMYRLIALYPVLHDGGVRVVSISADTDSKRYEAYSRKLPWKDKLCDFEGFSGDNFANYNVIGTPCFVLLERDNQLSGMFYSVAELEEKIRGKN